MTAKSAKLSHSSDVAAAERIRILAISRFLHLFKLGLLPRSVCLKRLPGFARGGAGCLLRSLISRGIPGRLLIYTIHLGSLTKARAYVLKTTWRSIKGAPLMTMTAIFRYRVYDTSRDEYAESTRMATLEKIKRIGGDHPR